MFWCSPIRSKSVVGKVSGDNHMLLFDKSCCQHLHKYIPNGFLFKFFLLKVITVLLKAKQLMFFVKLCFLNANFEIEDK